LDFCFAGQAGGAIAGPDGEALVGEEEGAPEDVVEVGALVAEAVAVSVSDMVVVVSGVSVRTR
jgi:hypothetical protein